MYQSDHKRLPPQTTMPGVHRRRPGTCDQLKGRSLYPPWKGAFTKHLQSPGHQGYIRIHQAQHQPNAHYNSEKQIAQAWPNTARSLFVITFSNIRVCYAQLTKSQISYIVQRWTTSTTGGWTSMFFCPSVFQTSITCVTRIIKVDAGLLTPFDK